MHDYIIYIIIMLYKHISIVLNISSLVLIKRKKGGPAECCLGVYIDEILDFMLTQQYGIR